MEKTIIDASSCRVQQFIQANLPVAPVPTVPELRLHRAGPKSRLSRLAELDEDFGAPYWAYEWGGGLALARHILDHPEIVVGRKVLDLGAGSGIVAIAAAKSGARKVIAADTDRYALAAIRLNAAVNEVRVLAFLGDMTSEAPPAVDVVLVGDLFYAQDLAQRVTTFLERCIECNIEILIGDPKRAFLPRARLELLAEYPGSDFGCGKRSEQMQNAVFAFKACGAARPMTI